MKFIAIDGIYKAGKFIGARQLGGFQANAADPLGNCEHDAAGSEFELELIAVDLGQVVHPDDTLHAAPMNVGQSIDDIHLGPEYLITVLEIPVMAVRDDRLVQIGREKYFIRMIHGQVDPVEYGKAGNDRRWIQAHGSDPFPPPIHFVERAERDAPAFDAAFGHGLQHGLGTCAVRRGHHSGDGNAGSLFEFSNSGQGVRYQCDPLTVIIITAQLIGQMIVAVDQQRELIGGGPEYPDGFLVRIIKIQRYRRERDMIIVGPGMFRYIFELDEAVSRTMKVRIVDHDACRLPRRAILADAGDVPKKVDERQKLDEIMPFEPLEKWSPFRNIRQRRSDFISVMPVGLADGPNTGAVDG